MSTSSPSQVIETVIVYVYSNQPYKISTEDNSNNILDRTIENDKVIKLLVTALLGLIRLVLGDEFAKNVQSTSAYNDENGYLDKQVIVYKSIHPLSDADKRLILAAIAYFLFETTMTGPPFVVPEYRVDLLPDDLLDEVQDYINDVLVETNNKKIKTSVHIECNSWMISATTCFKPPKQSVCKDEDEQYIGVISELSVKKADRIKISGCAHWLVVPPGHYEFLHFMASPKHRHKLYTIKVRKHYESEKSEPIRLIEEIQLSRLDISPNKTRMSNETYQPKLRSRTIYRIKKATMS